MRRRLADRSGRIVLFELVLFVAVQQLLVELIDFQLFVQLVHFVQFVEFVQLLELLVFRQLVVEQLVGQQQLLGVLGLRVVVGLPQVLAFSGSGRAVWFLDGASRSWTWAMQ